jgi:hypothetical protein
LNEERFGIVSNEEMRKQDQESHGMMQDQLGGELKEKEGSFESS